MSAPPRSGVKPTLMFDWPQSTFLAVTALAWLGVVGVAGLRRGRMFAIFAGVMLGVHALTSVALWPHFRGLGLAPVREADAGTNDGLTPVRRGRDAEAERHAQAIRPLVAVDRKDLDAYSAHASAWSGRAGASLSRPVRRS